MPSDIDDKLKLGIAQPVCHWLTNKYFPSAYHEPSTGGHGVHLYLKLVMPRNESVFHVAQWMHSFMNYLSYDLVQWLKGSYFINKRIDFLNSSFKTSNAEDAVFALARSTVDRVCGLPSCFDDSDRLKRGTCIRLPRFPDQMESVIAFNNQPFVLFSPWRTQMDTLLSTTSILLHILIICIIECPPLGGHRN